MLNGSLSKKVPLKAIELANDEVAKLKKQHMVGVLSFDSHPSTAI